MIPDKVRKKKVVIKMFRVYNTATETKQNETKTKQKIFEEQEAF